MPLLLRLHHPGAGNYCHRRQRLRHSKFCRKQQRLPHFVKSAVCPRNVFKHPPKSISGDSLPEKMSVILENLRGIMIPLCLVGYSVFELIEIIGLCTDPELFDSGMQFQCSSIPCQGHFPRVSNVPNQDK